MTPNLTAKLLPIIVSVILFSAQWAPLPWNESLENATLDLQFTLRGERSLAGEILFVYLGPEDVSALGGWPITRDFYAYIIHILGERHARTIAFDLLFGRPGTQFPEHDEMLANMISLSPSVCLPMSYQQFDKTAIIGMDGWQLYEGRQTLQAFPALRQAAGTAGFSNLGSEPVVRRVPLIAREGDRLAISFGVEMARRFRQLKSPAALAGDQLLLGTGDEGVAIPVDDHGRIILNHFGGLTSVRRMGFVELLQRYQNAPDSLSFDGQLVVVGVTHTGVPALHATPFASDLPSSLIHATVAENIIRQNYIRPLPAWLAGLLVLAMTLRPLFLPRERSPFLMAAVTIVLFLGGTFVLFTYAFRLAPLFYPLGGFAISLLLTRRHRRSLQEDQLTSLHTALRQQLSEKERTLHEARTALETLEAALLEQNAETENAHQKIAHQRSELQKLENEVRDLQSYIVPQKTHAPGAFREIIYSPESPMKAVLDLVQRIREEDIPVLITGETGTGKEMIARAIHRTGRRGARPFVAVNCGALPETLLESELFGHEKGSFTGAQSQRRGRFELADGGTIFLDEIAETTPAFQARLLRVLQEGTFERVGGEKTLQVDVRIIAAGNSDLQAEIEKNAFRADLFYRLNGFPIALAGRAMCASWKMRCAGRRYWQVVNSARSYANRICPRGLTSPSAPRRSWAIFRFSRWRPRSWHRSAP